MRFNSNYNNTFGLDEHFLYNLNNFSKKGFINLYQEKYPYFDETQVKVIEYRNNDYSYKGYYDVKDIDFFVIPSLQRYYWSKTDIDKPKKIVPVEVRERELFFDADGMYFLKLNEEGITKEKFVYFMIRNIHYNYKNDDNKLTTEYIIERCKNIWERYFSGEVELKPNKNKVLKMDRFFWKSYDSPIEAYTQAKKLLNDDYFGELYDFNLSIEENLKLIEEYKNRKIDIRTLKRWLEENNLNYFTKKEERNKVIMEVYNEDKNRSLRDIVKIVNERGYKVSKDTINKVINK